MRQGVISGLSFSRKVTLSDPKFEALGLQARGQITKVSSKKASDIPLCCASGCRFFLWWAGGSTLLQG